MASKITISPEPFIQKCKSLTKAKNLCVDVEDRCIRLAWPSVSDDCSTDKVEYIDRIEGIRLGISYDLLIDAVSECGGKIDIDGHYPVTHEIVRKLGGIGLRT